MNLTEIIIFFLISYFLGLNLLPIVLDFGEKFRIYDYPNNRKINKTPLIRIGGLGIISSFLVSLILFSLYKGDFTLFSNPVIYAPLLFSIIGFIDDISNLTVLRKLTAQILIAILLYFQGLNVGNLFAFSDYGFSLELLRKFDIYLTVLWIVGITNAINWTDGLDGLAAGVSIIFYISLLAISFYQNNINFIIISILLLGSCFAFLKSNYYPAKIIMGDNGSYFLGSSIAICSISVFSINSNELSIFVPLLMLFIPITDMAIVIFKRMINRKSPFLPDKLHLHHRLIVKIKSHKKTVLIIHFLSAIFTILGLILFFNF